MRVKLLFVGILLVLLGCSEDPGISVVTVNSTFINNGTMNFIGDHLTNNTGAGATNFFSPQYPNNMNITGFLSIGSPAPMTDTRDIILAPGASGISPSIGRIAGTGALTFQSEYAYLFTTVGQIPQVELGVYSGTPYIQGNYNRLQILGGAQALGNFTVNYKQVCLIDGTNCLIPTWHNATSIQTIRGTPSGSLANVLIHDHITYNVTELSGPNPLDLEINFSGVSSFNTVLVNFQYDGTSGHTIQYGLYDYVTHSYEYEYGSTTGTPALQYVGITVWDSQDHISAGKVSFRFHHVNNGVNSHHLLVDYIRLQ